MLTRKHFKAVAEIINKTANKAYQITLTKNLAIDLANYFATENPKFDRERFFKACGL